jgi:hypothetical protein
MTLKIDIGKFKNMLVDDHGVPYTVYSVKPFVLDSRLEQDVFDPKGDGKNLKIVGADFQLETYHKSLDTSQRLGWTACYTSTGNLGYAEACAAYLMGHYLAQNRGCLWIDVGVALRKNYASVEELQMRNIMSTDAVALVVMTGLSMTDSPHRLSRAFDILRSTSRHCSKVVVAAGGTPLQVMDKLNLPVQRLLNITTYESVSY